MGYKVAVSCGAGVGGVWRCFVRGNTVATASAQGLQGGPQVACVNVVGYCNAWLLPSTGNHHPAAGCVLPVFAQCESPPGLTVACVMRMMCPYGGGRGVVISGDAQ